MLRNTNGPPQAAVFEHIQAVGKEGVAENGSLFPYFGRELYTVNDRPGIFRRVKRQGTMFEPSTPGAVAAVWDGGIIHLVPDERLRLELAEAGYVEAAKTADGPQTALAGSGAASDAKATNGPLVGEIGSGGAKAATENNETQLLGESHC